MRKERKASGRREGVDEGVMKLEMGSFLYPSEHLPYEEESERKVKDCKIRFHFRSCLASNDSMLPFFFTRRRDRVGEAKSARKDQTIWTFDLLYTS